MAGRWNSYLKLMAETAYTENEGNYLRGKNAKYKAISKINKKNRKNY